MGSSQSRSTTSHALYLHRKTEKERAGESQVDWHHFLQECSDWRTGMIKTGNELWVIYYSIKWKKWRYKIDPLYYVVIPQQNTEDILVLIQLVHFLIVKYHPVCIYYWSKRSMGSFALTQPRKIMWYRPQWRETNQNVFIFSRSNLMNFCSIWCNTSLTLIKASSPVWFA